MKPCVLTPNSMHRTMQTGVFTHMRPGAIIYIFIACFIFEAPISPNAKTYCWFQSSQSLQEIYNLNLSALIYLFLNYMITFSLLQKILLLCVKLLTGLLLTLVKQLLRKKIFSSIKHVYGNKCNPFLA